MKISLPMYRPSVPISSRNAPNSIRRTHILQRAAGKLFHQWAEVENHYLQDFIYEYRDGYEFNRVIQKKKKFFCDQL